MKTIILSDTAFIGTNYLDAKDGISYLKNLQEKGVKIITLSNRPELCMRKIGIHIGSDEKTSYRYLGACDRKGNGIDLVFHNDSGLKESTNLKSDFTVFGNGICSFDKDDNLIYQGKFINRDMLNAMVEEFRRHGYTSYGEYLSLQKDSLGDRCFAGREDVYKFFSPEIGTDKINDRVYGMQCSSRSEDEDRKIIGKIEGEIPEIVGYRLNNKPCFYQKGVNKLVALNYIMNEYNLSFDNSIIILSELTDNVISEEYSHLAHYVGSEHQNSNDKEQNNSLAKILQKVM